MVEHAKCNKLMINEVCQFCTDCVAFWTVVTKYVSSVQTVWPFGLSLQRIELPPSSATEPKMKAAHSTYKMTVSQLRIS